MTRDSLIQASHLARSAVIYVRQSTTKQLALHQESTRRQYQLTETAQRLGWPQPRIQVIDDDLGLSGASSTQRTPAVISGHMKVRRNVISVAVSLTYRDRYVLPGFDLIYLVTKGSSRNNFLFSR